MIRGYPNDSSGNSESKYVLVSGDTELPNSVVISAGTNVSLDSSVPGILTINASGGTELSGEPFVTFQSSGTLSAERVVTAGNNVSINLTIPGQVIINAQATGGGAPTTPTYVTADAEGSLTNSYILAPGAGITVTKNAPNLEVGLSAALLGYSFLTTNPASLLTNEKVLSVTGGLSSSETASTLVISASNLQNVPYVTIGNDSNLPNERALAVGTGLFLTDGGPGASATLVNTGSGFNTITVTGQGNVVADALLDTLTLSPGTGISMAIDVNTDTITITNSSPNVAQNVFTNVVVSGWGDIVADNTTDTLTVIGTNGIFAGTVPGTDTLVISGSGITSNIVQNVFDRFSVSGYPDAVADSATDALTFVGIDGIVLQINPATDTITISASGVVSGTNTFGTISTAGWPNVVADNTADTLTLTATDGLYWGTVPGTDTLVISGSGITSNIAQNVFDRIAVAGYPNVIADSITDTLTFVGIDGVVLQLDPATDTMTISASGVVSGTNTFGTVAVSGWPSIVADSTTDTMTVTGTDGIAVGTVAGTDTLVLSGSGLNIFKTISVSGQSDVVADSFTDTLTIAAGTGIAITTNAGTDTITITNTVTDTDAQNLFLNVSVPGFGDIVADSPTDTLTVVGTNGIKVGTTPGTDTLTLSGSGLPQTAFTTITVAGQSDVVSDSIADTLTLVAGRGTSITTDASTDTITLNSTASSINVIHVSGQNDILFDLNKDLTFVAGDNISLTTDATSRNLTITGIAASGTTSDSFTNIAVSGQSNIVADSSTDTLTVVAGTGISLTTNAGTDTLTITNSSPNTNQNLFNIIAAPGWTNITASSPTTTLTASGVDGISVGTSGSTLIISASGVNSFGTVTVSGQSDVVADQANDVLTIVNGTGIAVTTNAGSDTITITNTSPNASQNVFDRVAIAGQNTVIADSVTDTLTLVAGTGIALTTDDTTDTITVTNSSPNTSQNLFETIAVAGQSSIVADNTTDTLTIVKGAGIDLTTNAGTDTLTILNSASGFAQVLVSGQTTVTATQLENSIEFIAGTNMTLTTAGTSVTFNATDTQGNAFTNISTTGFGDVVADSVTDTLTILGTNGIFVGGTPATDTLTFSGSGLPQTAFTTISVATQSDVVADSIADTLTLVAGTGIGITTNAGTDTITVTNSSPNTNQNIFETLSVSGFGDIVADNANDVLTVVGTNGINIGTTPGTDTLTISGSSLPQTAFTTISVATQSDVVSDSIADTLTYVAGTGMAITTNAGTDTITFTNSAPNVVQNLFSTIAAGPNTWTPITASSPTTTLTASGVDGIFIGTSGSTLIISGSGVTGGGNSFGTITVSGQSDLVADQANDVLTIVAGTGISLANTAGTDTLTITNSSPNTNQNLFETFAVAGWGSVVADNTTDTLTVVGSEGIAIGTNAATDTIVISGSALNIFKTISVATQSDVVADSYTDTLTYVAGTGMAITTDASTDTITFTNSSPNTNQNLFSTVATNTGWSSFTASSPTTTLTASGVDGIVIGSTGASTLVVSGSGLNIFKTISVSGQSDVVADSYIDTLTLVAGTGVSLTTNASTDTITITNSAPMLNTFSTVSVSGQSDVVADSTADTLTMAAGTGISITTNAGTDTVTITNSSPMTETFKTISTAGWSDVVADSTTDTLTLVGDSGIQIGTAASTDTITISGSGLNIFKTISVSGQSDVVADAYNDTLTLVGGTGMTITTNASTDTITFAAGGGAPSFTVSSKTASFNASVGNVYRVDLTSAGTVTATLDTAASVTGQSIIVKVIGIGTGTLGFASTSSQTFEDGATTSFTPTTFQVGDEWEFMSDGSNWMLR